MRERIYTTLAAWAERRPWWMLGAALIVTLGATMLASSLELNMQFKSLMPQSHPTVQEYDNIVDSYRTATSIIIAASGEEQVIKAFADDLAPRLRSMTDQIGRVDYRTNREFILENGLMLARASDLKNMEGMYTDLRLVPFLRGLNDSFEKTYVADGEGISNAEKEDRAVASLDGIEYWLGAMQAYTEGDGDASTAHAAVDRLLIGDPYLISQDKDMILLFAQPTFTINDIHMTVDTVNEIDSLIVAMSPAYPGIDAGITGLMALGRDEMEAIESDMMLTTLLAFILIIALFVISFRMWAAPLLAGASLIVGIIWAAGFAALTVGSLNMMTSMFAVILVGLGIDYNIHVISGYTEFRSEGESIGEAMRLALTKTGGGIVIGSITTAMAFLAMLVSENQGMKEFAIVTGSGVLFCMLSSLLVLPSLLVVRDRRIAAKKTDVASRTIAMVRLGQLAERLAAHPVIVLTSIAVVTVLLLVSALRTTFDYNYLNMEPVGLKSIELQDRMIDEFSVTPDMVLITTTSVEESRRIADEAKELKSVGMVTRISSYLPSEEERQRRLPYIRQIRADLSTQSSGSGLAVTDTDALINELYRLEDNVIELAQLAYAGGQDKVDRKARAIVGDLEDSAGERVSLVTDLVESLDEAAIEQLGLFEAVYEPVLRSMALDMTSEAPITLSDLPPDILNQFANDDTTQFLVSIYPRQQVWDLEFLGRFTEQMHRIDERVTGMPPIFYVLVDYIGRDGTTAAMLAVTVIFLLLWVDYRRISLAMMAMLSLVVAAIWMVGLMNLFGMQFNLINVIGIPLILGIGIDDAVHILNRYRVEGRGKLAVVFSSTGKAVVLTSLTTMIAFGSLGFAVYRGLASLGLTLLIGVGTALGASLFLLPVLLGLLDRQKAPKKTSGPVVAGFVALLLIGTGGVANAQDDVLEIIRKIDANESVESSRSVGRQIITTSSGSERTLEMESFAKGMNDKMLSVYTGPARVRGDKILMLNDGDDIWFYTPKTDRVRHLASHARRQKVQGSDFSYEDMISGNMEEDYTHRLLGRTDIDGVECFEIESIPTEDGPSYSKIIVWAETERYVVRRIDYYDDGDLLKRLILSDFQELEGHIIPFRMVMENLRDGGQTTFEFSEMELNIELPDRLFTTNNLKRR